MKLQELYFDWAELNFLGEGNIHVGLENCIW